MFQTRTPTSNQPSAKPLAVPHEKVAARAYEKWCKRGRPQGTAMQDWLEAERELQMESGRMSVPGQRR